MKRIGVIILTGLVVALATTTLAYAQHRGGGYSAQVEKVVGGLDYHALVIGINSYQSGIPKLSTSVNDARAVKEVLVNKYGFSFGNVIELYDGQATRSKILRALRELSISLGDDDALLVYYAGHGIEDLATGLGYWIPVDARPNEYDTYIANSDVRNYLKAIKARHIFLISDSCFSGSLLATRAMPGDIDNRFYAQKAKKRSRIVLTSGGNEPVMDAGKSGHSIFAYFLLNTLKDYDEPFLIPTQIFTEVGKRVADNSSQTPQWGSLREAMDEGGEIVFVNREYAAPSYLSFRANKTGRVYLNGEFVGQTPLYALPVKPGTYEYRIACAELGSELSGKVRVSAGRTERVRLTFLPPKEGFLTVYTDPWTNVFVNNKKIGGSPLYRVKLKPGSYVLKLENPEFKVMEIQELVVEPEKETVIRKNLK
jgi:Caspase domain/PEGA domain